MKRTAFIEMNVIPAKVNAMATVIIISTRVNPRCEPDFMAVRKGLQTANPAIAIELMRGLLPASKLIVGSGGESVKAR